MPEVLNGQNVYDYIDPDIDVKLQALEEEEERLEQEGFYESDEAPDDEEQAVLRKAELIREKQAIIRSEARLKKRLHNRAILPRKAMKKPLSELDEALDVLGVDTTDIMKRKREESRGRSRKRTDLERNEDAMDLDPHHRRD